ncbi:MAG: hypothetical protein WBG42_10555 [Cryomorphaceae bacterium]
MRKSLKISITLSIVFVGLIRLKPIWERSPGGNWNLLVYLSILILFFWISVKVLKEIVRLIKNRKTVNFRSFTAIGILLIGLIHGIFNPLNIDLEKIYGDVTFRACYEGTMNQATFKLRDDGDFDIHWTGAFFYDEYFTGNYVRRDDSLFMHYDNKVPRWLGDTLIVRDDYLYRLKSDSVLTTHFYLGYCQGLN